MTLQAALQKPELKELNEVMRMVLQCPPSTQPTQLQATPRAKLSHHTTSHAPWTLDGPVRPFLLPLHKPKY